MIDSLAADRRTSARVPAARAPPRPVAPCRRISAAGPEIKFGHGGRRAGAGRPRNPVPKPMPAAPPEPRWHAYATHPQAEQLAARELSRTGYTGYAPLIAIRRQDPVIHSLFHKVLAPRFIGYGFVLLDPADPWRPVAETAGVRQVLLGSNGRPAPIAAGVIERHRADDERLCDLARETMPPLPRGALVRIEGGALAGYVGEVVDCDGLTTTVEVDIFGRLVPVRHDRASVAVLAETPAK